MQGAGGNTSLKTGDRLLIKASGIWLSEVGEGGGFVAVDRERLLHDLAADADRTEDPKPYALPGEALRPSIETTLHAVLPQRVVLHTHSVDAIARLCAGDPREALSRLDGMDGVRPVLVPYARPGLPLTQAVLAACEASPHGSEAAGGPEAARGCEANVLLLANHGLVAAADTVGAADALLWAVTQRLKAEPRTGMSARDASRDEAWRALSYRPVPSPQDRAQGLATCEASARAATSGSLYPDHVVFLGRGLSVADGPDTLADGPDTPADGPRASGPVVVLDPGHGFYIREDASRAAMAMALCLADVALRVGGRTRPLSRSDEDALLGWDAEKHRQKLERAEAER